jgi:hypothetical protein
MSADEHGLVDLMDAVNDRIFTKKDARIFLLGKDLQKDCALRLVSWLMLFDLIPAARTEFAAGVLGLYTAYNKIVTHTPGGSDPLPELKDVESRVIRCDIERSINWLHKMAEQVEVDNFYLQDAEVRTCRVLGLLSLVGKFSYFQGFDRFVLSCYLLVLKLTSKKGVSSVVAEALSYHMTLKFLELTKQPVEMSDMLKGFERLDKDLRKQAPAVYAGLDPFSYGSVYFALRWKTILFADEHKVRDLWLIWDYVVANLKDFRKFLNDLCGGHLVQVPVDDSFQLEKIQKFRDWDVVRIIEYAALRQRDRKRGIFGKKWFYVVILILLLLWINFRGFSTLK